jgi:hypothetical protein
MLLAGELLFLFSRQVDRAFATIFATMGSLVSARMVSEK